jgi:hypothetical protein
VAALQHVEGTQGNVAEVPYGRRDHI